MKSTEVRSAQRRSSLSFSDSAGTLTATPGRLRPLWSLTLPATSTRGGDVGVVHLHHAEPELAVVDQDRVALRHVAGQALVRRTADRGVARRRRGS